MIEPDDEGVASGPGHGAGAALSEVDPRVVAALEEYLGLVKEGRRPPRNEFLARDPAIAEALAECLDGLELVQSAGALLSPSGPTPPRADERPAATLLGDYRIVREVGRGGMGVVYEAEQVSLGRRVALKVLPFAAAIDPRQRQRFQLEAQAAAHLNHPHIVPIYAVGCEQGAHYYAMQFIEGRSLADVIHDLRPHRARVEVGADDETRPDASSAPAVELVVSKKPEPTTGSSDPGSSSGLSGRGRGHCRAVAELGRQAAEALEHAHRLGVLHRDVKPGNLMVDARGDLWITDFGLARFLDEGGLTRTGDLLGTLRYMSPEQAQARRAIVDQRTDVYSLGATLYELLTLRPVFNGRDRQELLRQIALDEPTPPRKIEPAISRDLETIVLKALAKDPAARYATAQEMAEDLGRYLADQPIQARRPSPAEHLAKWSRRHRPAVVTAAVVLVLAGAVGAGLLWREHRRTQVAYERAKLAHNFAFEVGDQLIMGAMQKFFELSAGQGPTPVYPQFYTQALDYYERTAEQLKDDPEMQSVVAGALHRAGFIRMVTRRPGAEPMDPYLRAVAIYKRLIARPGADPELRSSLASLYGDMGLYRRYTGAPAEAVSHYREAAAVRRSLVDEAPAGANNLNYLVDSTVSHASILADLNRPEDARRVVDELLGYLGGLEKRLGDAAGRRLLAFSYAPLGKSLAARQPLRAEQVFRRGLQVDPAVAELNNGLAWLLVIRPDRPPYAPAEGLRLARAAAAAAPGDANIKNTLGVAQYRAGDWKAAIATLEESARLSSHLPHDTLFLAMAYERAGDHARADAWYGKATARMDELKEQGGVDPDLVPARREAEALIGRR